MGCSKARGAAIAAIGIATGLLYSGVVDARWEERVERQCTNQQVCQPVQKTQQECRTEQVCRLQPQTTTKCETKSQCQTVTRYVQQCQPVTNCVQGKCTTTNSCRNVPQQQQVCQPQQVCQQVMVNAQKCAPEQRCQPKVVTTQECTSQPQCQNVTKRVWVPDPVQPAPSAATPKQAVTPPPVIQTNPQGMQTGNANSTPPMYQSNTISGGAQPSANQAAEIARLQAYKKELEEKLKALQAQKAAGAQTVTPAPLPAPSVTGSSASRPSTPSPQATTPTYTFARTPSGNVEVFQNGQRISTGTAEHAKQYGYQPTGTGTPVPASGSASGGTAVPKTSPSPATSYVQMQTANGPAYFQQTPSGLMAVSDSTTIARLKSGEVASTTQAYSSAVTFAAPAVGQWTSTPSAAKSAPQPAPSSTPTLQPAPQARGSGQPQEGGSGASSSMGPVPPMTVWSSTPSFGASGVAATTPSKLPNQMPIATGIGQSPLAQTTIGVVEAVGGAAAEIVPGRLGFALQTLGKVKTGADLWQANQSGKLAEQVVQSGLTHVAVKTGMSLGAAHALQAGASTGLIAGPTVAATALTWGGAAGATAVLSYKFGEHVIAPRVAPTIGNWMFNMDQQLLGGRLFMP